MYIPEPPKDPMMEKVGENKPQLSQRQTLLALVVRQNSPPRLLLPPRLEQSHARALARAKSQQRILAHPVKPAAPPVAPDGSSRNPIQIRFPHKDPLVVSSR